MGSHLDGRLCQDYVMKEAQVSLSPGQDPFFTTAWHSALNGHVCMACVEGERESFDKHLCNSNVLQLVKRACSWLYSVFSLCVCVCVCECIYGGARVGVCVVCGCVCGCVCVCVCVQDGAHH